MVMQSVAWLASFLVLLSFFMKTIVRLRTIAIASNIVFIGYALLGIYYGIFDKVLPILVLHVALLPLNLVRLREVKTAVKSLHEIKNKEQTLEFLIPYMKVESYALGQRLFSKGDDADCLYLIRSGRIELPEIGKFLGAGAVMGEVGVFAEKAKRTTSAVCAEDCELFSITADKVMELFYQEPRFGFFIVRALTRYLSSETPTGVNTVPEKRSENVVMRDRFLPKS